MPKKPRKPASKVTIKGGTVRFTVEGEIPLDGFTIAEAMGALEEVKQRLTEYGAVDVFRYRIEQPADEWQEL